MDLAVFAYFIMAELKRVSWFQLHAQNSGMHEESCYAISSFLKVGLT